jgi:signal transduction histidine kinase
VRKHAGTGQARVRLSSEDSGLRLVIEDDGPGLPSDPAPGHDGKHLGIRAMHERAAILGGTLTIVSSPGAGTTVIAEVPLPTSAKDYQA